MLTEQPTQALVQSSAVDEADGDPTGANSSSDQQLGQFISSLLKYGVLLASGVVLIGGVLYLIRHGMESADYRLFQAEPTALRSPCGIVNAALSGSRLGMIQLGLLLLMATPIARVLLSLMMFLRQRDFTYVAVTSFVLLVLIYSFIGAYF
ncbi:MAG: DUF1634 domain-containing protein [Leptolyngbyaceae cyanobacterium RU_5_1]|nr:DUF1634 domain-containing protein [Leptolyngbyaceae cyanobacterium RU_5_1]